MNTLTKSVDPCLWMCFFLIFHIVSFAIPNKKLRIIITFLLPTLYTDSKMKGFIEQVFPNWWNSYVKRPNRTVSHGQWAKRFFKKSTCNTKDVWIELCQASVCGCHPMYYPPLEVRCLLVRWKLVQALQFTFMGEVHIKQFSPPCGDHARPLRWLGHLHTGQRKCLFPQSVWTLLFVKLWKIKAMSFSHISG